MVLPVRGVTNCPAALRQLWTSIKHHASLVRAHTHTGFAADTLRVVTTAANTIHGRRSPFITRRSCYIIQPMAARGGTVSGFIGQASAGRTGIVRLLSFYLCQFFNIQSQGEDLQCDTALGRFTLYRFPCVSLFV